MSSRPSFRAPRQMASALWAERAAVLASFALAIYRGAAGGLPILLGLFIAHEWGLEQLAAFTLANATLSVALVIGDWGSSRFLPREMARGGPAASAVLATSTSIRLVLMAGMAVVTAGLASSGFIAHDVVPYLILLAPVGIVSVVAVNAVSLRVVEANMRGVLAAVVVGSLPVVVAALFAKRLPGASFTLVGLYAAGKVIETAMLVNRRWELCRPSLRHARRIFTMLMPFGASAVIAVLYARLPVFVAAERITRLELGVISASIALQNVILLFPVAMAAMTFPRVATAAMERDRLRLAREVVRYAQASMGIVVVGLALIWTARDLIARALSVPPESSHFLVLYAAVGIFSVASTMAAATLQALSAERGVAAAGLAVLILAIPVQIYGATRWGMWGTLAAVTVTDGLAASVLTVSAWRRSRSLCAPADPLAERLRASD